jgi:Flp pilus assembly pilin Flp
MLEYLRIVLAGRVMRGASTVEYALLVAGVALVLLAVAPPLFDAVRAAFIATEPETVSTP